MSLSELFQSAVAELQCRGIPFAVAGGLAADLYRREPRLTMDVDLAILAGPDSVKTATEILQIIGLEAGIVRTADFAGGPLFAIKKKSSPPCLIVGRKHKESDGPGVDFLLPEIPWVEQALNRARDHVADFGFGEVPVLTMEDVILSKLYAIQSSKVRAKDLDDLQSIYETKPDLNLPYLAGQMQSLHLTIPRTVLPLIPKELAVLDKTNRRGHANRS